MIVTFVSPSSKHPVGGVIAVFEFANALARRGHEVHLAHVPGFWGGIEHPRDLAWASFEPSIQHHVLASEDDPLPVADFAVSGNGSQPATSGLPLVLVQGRPTTLTQEHSVFEEPFPKICVSRWVVDLGREFGVPAEQLVHIPLGVDHDVFRVMVPMKERPQCISFRYASFPTRRSAVTLRAVERARVRFPALTVKAFGFEAPASIPEWMTFRQSVTWDDLAVEFYNASSIFVCTSEAEGFGLPSLEAMSCGCALVTVANGGSNEYAIDGETALVCASADPDEVTDRVMTLLGDDEFRIALAERGREYATRFRWDVAGEKLESFLEAYGTDPDAYQHVVERQLQP